MLDECNDRTEAVRCALDEFLDRLARAVVEEVLGPDSDARPRANSAVLTPVGRAEFHVTRRIPGRPFPEGRPDGRVGFAPMCRSPGAILHARGRLHPRPQLTPCPSPRTLRGRLCRLARPPPGGGPPFFGENVSP